MYPFPTALVLFAIAAAPVQAAEIIGPARAIDGDTLLVGDNEIHLLGIDAPEMDQLCKDSDDMAYACGENAQHILATLVSNQSIRCENPKIDRHNNLNATCYTDKVNLNVEMIRQGWALAYRIFLEGYVPAQMEAHRAKRGLWSGTFDMPWDWRRSQSPKS